MTTDSLTTFSANANLVANNSSSAAISFPLVQGMGFVTAIYNSVTPYIDSSIFFRTVTPVNSPKSNVVKYKLLLEDGKTWLLYATATSGDGLALTATSSSRLQAAGPFTGTIQIAKNPGDVAEQEQSYDSSAGAYPTGASLAASVDGSSASYSLRWGKGGADAPLMMFALPHHVESMDEDTSSKRTNIQLQTTTKGLSTGVAADAWTMVEPNLPTSISFAPWDVETGSTQSISAAAKDKINSAGASDLAQDMDQQSNLNSMYYGGKALSKFATAIYAVHDLSGNTDVAGAGLSKLKDAYARFAGNTQQYPLVYESAWGGVVSTASYDENDPGVDFGNTSVYCFGKTTCADRRGFSYYNDHHFHWSYFIHAASIIGYLDPTWLDANKG